MHAVVLEAMGGSFFQKILDTNIKEKKNREINFLKYSEITIAAFIDFIYLGGKEVQKRITQDDLIVDVIELFDFAHTYQIDILKDCCFNSLCFFSTSENAMLIASLAEQYSDESLKSLALKLDPHVNM